MVRKGFEQEQSGKNNEVEAKEPAARGERRKRSGRRKKTVKERIRLFLLKGRARWYLLAFILLLTVIIAVTCIIMKQSRNASPETNERIQGVCEWDETMSVTMDGTTFTAGQSYSTLVDAGWEIDKSYYSADEKWTLQAESETSRGYMIGRAGKAPDSYMVQIDCTNESDAEKGIEDCIITSISVTKTGTEATPSLSLPGNVSWNTTSDEIEELYGTPSYTTTASGNIIMGYIKSNDTCVKTMLLRYDAGGKLYNVTLMISYK